MGSILMGRKLKIAGVDPALSNMGIVLADYDIETKEIEIKNMFLVTTSKESGKQVRVSSDDLRRAVELHDSFQIATKDVDMVFAEIPSGGQSARAVYGFGIAVGIMASCSKPLIQIQPTEAKKAAVGTKTASKQEMIEWATEKYPNAPWIRARGKKDGAITNANEHLADACAIIQAGINSTEFRNALTILDIKEK